MKYQITKNRNGQNGNENKLQILIHPSFDLVRITTKLGPEIRAKIARPECLRKTAIMHIAYSIISNKDLKISGIFKERIL